MEASGFEQREDEQAADEETAADPSSERSPEGTEDSPSESTADSAAADELDSSSESAEEAPAGETQGESSESSDAPGALAGTSSELEHGVGGTGDHPAPAAMRDQDGGLHSAGQPPAGTVEGEESPVGDATDLTDAEHAQSPEAREELERVHEPDQVGTERPDLGTE